MNQLEPKRIRVDWEELKEAFADGSKDHRYYLDRETGAVHFFSSYLDNEDDEEDERILTADERYVLIPADVRALPNEELLASTLDKDKTLQARIKNWLRAVAVEPL
ncbi:MAG TPA: hypothetical protein VLK65_23805 [Vicinamibacteria bacterium]|nr:hypothetical protein [Vicinamibacteria bacterium]